MEGDVNHSRYLTANQVKSAHILGKDRDACKQ